MKVLWTKEPWFWLFIGRQWKRAGELPSANNFVLE
jgi:hypothetical protein